MGAAAIALALVFVAFAVWFVPLTARGAGGASGTFHLDQAVVTDVAFYGPIVAVSDGERFRGYEIGTGDQRWRTTGCRGAEVAGLTASQEQEVLVVRCGTEIRALDLLTGSFLWTYDPGAAWTMVRAGGGVVAIGLTDHVDVVDLDTGERRFRWDGEHVEEQELIVAVADDLVVIAEDDQLIALTPDGTERWRRDVVATGSIWVNDHVVVQRDRESVTSYDAATGEEIHWFETRSEVRNSMIVADDAGVVAVARNDADSSGVYGLDVDRGTMDWSRPGTSLLAAGPRHVAFVDDQGRCRVVRIRVAKRANACSEERRQTLVVALDEDRMAVVAIDPQRSGLDVVVRTL